MLLLLYKQLIIIIVSTTIIILQCSGTSSGINSSSSTGTSPFVSSFIPTYSTSTFAIRKRTSTILSTPSTFSAVADNKDHGLELDSVDDIQSLWQMDEDDNDDDDDDVIQDRDSDDTSINPKNLKESALSSSSSSLSSTTTVVAALPISPEEPTIKTSPFTTEEEIQSKIISNTNKRQKQKQKQTINQPKDQNQQSPLPRGVGRQGYNITILHSINYDQSLYNIYSTQESYETRVTLLEDYYTANGDLNVPFRYHIAVDDYDIHGHVSGSYEIHLGRWLHWIRTLYKKDVENEHKWKNTKDDDDKNTKNNNNKYSNNSNNSSKSKNDSAATKTSFRRKIPLEYIKRLNDIGMNWDGVGARRRPTKFREKCLELQKFTQVHGHSYVPKDWTENKSLAMWVERQRHLYRLKREGRGKGYQLTDERVDILHSIGFDFHGSMSKQQSGLSTNDVDSKFSHEHNVGSSRGSSNIDQEWWKVLDILREYRAIYGHCDINYNDFANGKLKGADIVAISYWIMEQKRQYSILHHDLNKSLSYNSVTPRIVFKCLLTPDRHEGLRGIDFDFSMNDFDFPFKFMPWQDIAHYHFDYKHLLQQMAQHTSGNASCNMHFDKDLMANIILSNEEQSQSWAMDENNTNLLYLFQQRIRWENRHQSLRDNTPNVDWILEKENLDVEAELNQLGFIWYEHDIPDINDIWVREYEWWINYYDLCRYKKANGDFALDPYGKWYSEELVDWIEEQKQNYRSFTASDDDNTYYFEEWHLQALFDAGYDFNAVEGSHPLQNTILNGPKPSGRPPAVLELEKDLEGQYNELPNDLKEVMKQSMNRKRVDNAEALAWLVRYEALRRLYIRGPGNLSTLSTDKDVCDHRLALWASNQRKQYQNYLTGKKSALTPGRISLLEEIHFDWKTPTADEEWEEMLSALKQFKAKFGHCFVPAVYSKDIRLGIWVHLQRQLYQLIKRETDVELSSSLNKKKAKQLIDIGLDLTMDNLAFGNISFETLWRCRLDELQEFKQNFGHCNVELDYTSQYYDLALWVNEQRILYKRAQEGVPSQLDDKRTKELNQIGFSWKLSSL